MTWSSWAPGRPGWLPRSTGPARGCAPWSSNPRPRAGRPAPLPGSRTTSASLPALPAPTWDAAPHIQATRFGAEFLTQRATGLRIEGQYRFVQLADGREVSSHVVLLAPGVQYRKLDIPGADA